MALTAGHHLWELRDEVYDAQRSGDVPYDHEAPIVPTRRIEDVAEILDEITPRRLALVARMDPGAPRARQGGRPAKDPFKLRGPSDL